MPHPFQSLLALLLAASVFSRGCVLGKVTEGGPQHLSEMSSIGQVLQRAGSHSVHILYVHGMDATGPQDSLIFQKGICEILKDCTSGSTVQRDYADGGIFQSGSAPPSFAYMGNPVWANAEEWSASAPFVDHYVITRAQGGPIVVDEINWWPLAFPLKCRSIVSGEAQLAGPDSTLLKLCATPTQKNANNPDRFDRYQWLSPRQAATLEAMPHRGALVNRNLKNSILDWGVSDAFMVVGSMHTLFREAMRQLFVKTARFHSKGAPNGEWIQQLQNPQGIDREFIVVSHSLGSYLVFSTLNVNEAGATPQNIESDSADNPETQDAAAQYILERTSLVYFFANQVALLELADVAVPAATPVSAQTAQIQPQATAKAALSRRISHWNKLRQNFGARAVPGAAPQPAEIFAWSDPSDVLTWLVPPIDNVKVDNLYVRNTVWHWLFADPSTAHGNYASNKDVLRVMMGP
jgi:hypothetical protein